MRIAVAKGDGIGPEIMDAVLNIFRAVNVPLEYDFVEMGKSIFDAGYSTGMTPEAQEIIEELGVLFKGPMETPKGKGVKSINVTARKVWNTYANQRDFRTLSGVETVFSKAGIPIQIAIIRENLEDTYGGIEHYITNDVAIARRIITRPGCKQVIRYAFEMARRRGFQNIVCGHKANIMKLTDGLFLDTFYEIAKDYPEMIVKDLIVDDLCMKLVTKPETFEVIVLTNLQGDIVSDLCAGMVGGLGFAPSANIGDYVSIFEAVHGTAPDIAGRNIANPTSLLLSGITMLRYLGFIDQASQIENSLIYTLESGVHTGDFGNKEVPSVNTLEFANAIIENLGKYSENEVNLIEQVEIPREIKERPLKNILRESEPLIERELIGVDVFIDCNYLPDEIAEITEKKLGDKFKLVTVTNRGTQVWPTGSVFTELVDQYMLRFEKLENNIINQDDVFELVKGIGKNFRICSTEMLMKFGDKLGYSLAQGQ